MRTRLRILLLTAYASILSALGQSPALPFRPEDKERFLRESEKAVQAAKLSRELEARAKLSNEGEEAEKAANEKAIAEAKKNAREIAALAGLPPSKPAATADPNDTVLEPKPKKALPPQSAVTEGSNIELEAFGESHFSAKDKIFIFTKDVKVKHPAFLLTCDKLEVHQEEDDQGKRVMKMAVATGGIVSIVGKSGDGEAVDAKCRMAVYTKEKIILRHWPQVRRGKTQYKATSDETVLTCFLKGKEIDEIKAKGPATIGLPESSSKPAR